MFHFAIGCLYCVHLRLYNPFPEVSFKSLLKAIVVLNMCNLKTSDNRIATFHFLGP